jgi:hypothetical protein
MDVTCSTYGRDDKVCNILVTVSQGRRALQRRGMEHIYSVLNCLLNNIQ